MQFIYSFKSEWLKKRRSLASWLIVIGAFFTPFVMIVARTITYKTLDAVNRAPDFWEATWKSAWESMAIFLLPLGAMLATSLITQLEYKNNTWKQLHTTPQHFTTLFFAKLAVIAVMLLQFLLLFNIGIWLTAMLPSSWIPGATFPAEPIPWGFFLKEDARYFVEAMPIMCLQYLVGLRFKNFLVSIGMGIILWILSIAVLSWKWGWIIPYTYTSFHYLQNNNRMPTKINIDIPATLYTVMFLAVGYAMYIGRREKG